MKPINKFCFEMRIATLGDTINKKQMLARVEIPNRKPLLFIM